MQVFLPYPEYHRCAKVLDTKRLWKQTVECKQLLITIKAMKEGKQTGWKHHPCTKMWYDYEESLREYMCEMLEEWLLRRFELTVTKWHDHRFKKLNDSFPEKPPWIGDKELHESHRKNLLFKDPKHYSKWFTDKIPEEKPYNLYFIDKEKKVV